MRPLVLIIMDGFGERANTQGNAIAAAKKPNLDRLFATYPHTTLGAAGLDVGLPQGQMGNSEVGHLNLGAGRIVYQDFTRINMAIDRGEIKENPALVKAMDELKGGSSLHLMGLLSDGGVHSHMNHLFALLEMARERGIKKVYVHAILDGRDVPPRSALNYFQQLEEKFQQLRLGAVATVAGRYYSMDRDRRWERTARGFSAMTGGQALRASSAREAVEAAYQRGESDEFVQPTIVDPQGVVKDGDSLIFFNFRPDRARQITRAFVDEDFHEFQRHGIKVHFVCMTQYDASLQVPVAFLVEYLHNTLGEVLSQAGLRQLRIAETEKYAHVTYFFNGGREAPNPGEDRVLIPSPKVPTYDQKPEMSAPEVTREVLERIDADIYQVIIMNYANSDMVGHTGIFPAAVKAVEAVDFAVGQVVDRVLFKDGTVLITSDHGNAEKMFDPSTGQPHTAHTTDRVPFIMVSESFRSRLRDDGILADVAPTMLYLLDLMVPREMTGRSLIIGSDHT